MLLKLPTGDSVVAVSNQRREGQRSALARRYCGWTVEQAAVGAGRVLVASARPISASPGWDTVLWGVPFNEDGELGDEAIAELLHNPSADSAWGRWVLVGPVAGVLRMVTGPDLVHSLVSCEANGLGGWATKAFAALDLVGQRPRLCVDRIPEFVTFEHVLCDEVLVGQVAQVPEASVIDIHPDGAWRVRSWWPWHARLGDVATESTPSELRAAVARVALGASRVEHAWLLSTSGRDSGLIASVLNEFGGALEGGLTFGRDADADMIGARAAAAVGGWEHRTFSAVDDDPTGLPAALARTAWTEGLDQAWNLVGKGLTWDGPDQALFINGAGGEIGRAFYWSGQPVTADPVTMLTDWISAGMAASARSVLRARVASHLEILDGGGDVPHLLDLQYARGRVRSWLERGRVVSDRRAGVAVYSQPPVAGVLLRLPERSRKTGSAFEQAIALDPTGLMTKVRESVEASTPAAAGRRAMRLLPFRRDPAVGMWREIRRQIPKEHQVADAVLGADWMRRTAEQARTSPLHRRMMWNALSTELLAASLD